MAIENVGQNIHSETGLLNGAWCREQGIREGIRGGRPKSKGHISDYMEKYNCTSFAKSINK